MVRRPRLSLESLETRRACAGLVAAAPEAGATSVPHVRLLDAETGAVLASTPEASPAFPASFRGGLRVALGDVTGDGVAEVIAAPGRGIVGEIRVFRRDGAVLTELPDYRIRPFGGGYKGGVELAVGDVDGDGREDIVAAMASGRGTVKVFLAAAAEAAPLDAAAAVTIDALPAGHAGGVTVAAADVGWFANGRLVSNLAPDNKVEIVIGTGAGAAPRVFVYDVSNRSAPRLADTITPVAYPQQAGLSVTAGRFNGDSIDDIFVSAGRGGGSWVHIYDGTVAAAANTLLGSFSALGGLARPNAPVFTAPVDANGDGLVDRFLQSQGDPRGVSGISYVSATTGERQAGLSSLAGPLRIATQRPFFKTQTMQYAGETLTYFDVFVGSGATPRPQRNASAEYTGLLTDGRVFDSSRLNNRGPLTFTLEAVPGAAGQFPVIDGWDAGFATMKVGGRRVLIVPPKLAYDASPPAGSIITAGATLVFDVSLTAAQS